MRVLGVIPAYNEADCIANAIAVLSRACDQIDVFDHGSTDETAEIIRAHTEKNPTVRHRYVDRAIYPIADEKGSQVFVFWYHIAETILSQVSDFDWVVWADADEILRQPNGAIVTKEAIERESNKGTDAIRPLLRQFRLTNADETQGDYLTHMRYHKINKMAQSPRVWRIHLTPPNLPDGAHIQDPLIRKKRQKTHLWWPEGTQVSNNEWLLDNYPFRSVEQATEKIRNGRDYLMPNGRRRFHQYIGRGGRIQNIVRPHTTLLCETRSLEMP